MSTNPSFHNYQTYLKIEELLSLQQPLSRAHDETLFIIVHQVYELWFKCMLHELERSGPAVVRRSARSGWVDAEASAAHRQGACKPARCHGDDDATLEFGAFRQRLGASSGFQSAQFREIEFILGYKRPSVLELFPEDSAEHQRLETLMAAPTLWDEFVGLLARSGYSIPASTRLDESGCVSPSGWTRTCKPR